MNTTGSPAPLTSTSSSAPSTCIRFIVESIDASSSSPSGCLLGSSPQHVPDGYRRSGGTRPYPGSCRRGPIPVRSRHPGGDLGAAVGAELADGVVDVDRGGLL